MGFEQNSELACFHELLKISNKTNTLLLTDNKNYIIGRERPDFTLWLWTRKELNKEQLNKIIDLLRNKVVNSGVNYIIVKKEVFDLWKEIDSSIEKKMDISFFRCQKIKKIDIVSGSFERPNYGDNVMLASCWCNNILHSHLQEMIPLNEALIEIEKEMDNKQLFVWKDEMGKVVSVARFEIIGSFAKISQVYTPKDCRKKGYASSLVYKLTEYLLEKKLIPVLFTDTNYVPSNHLYQKMGYEKEADLVRFEWNL